MNRPYIFCHMMTSLDGKIMGKYMETPEGSAAGDVFYNISFGKNPYYKHQGWLSGRVTTDDNFTFYEKPELDENAPTVPEGDFVAKKTDMYYVSVDPSGKLGWKHADLTYVDTTANVLEVLTGKAGNAYKAFLRKMGISYIIAGEDRGCRNNWHIHHAKSGGGQILLVTAGKGYYQEWGKEPRELHPGDVVNIPAEVKHWHGAAPDSWFAHLAVEVPAEGASNEWLEPVSDEGYGKL